MWGGRLPARSDGKAGSRKGHYAPEDANIGRAVWPERHGGVVVVEAEAGPGQAPVDGPPAAEIEGGQIPGVDPARSRRLRVGVDEAVVEGELGDDRRSHLGAGPRGPAAEAGPPPFAL